jgi:acyl carrier protein
VELGEIETALMQHEQVQQVVVSARADESGEQRLVAYVVAKDQMLTMSEMRQHLGEKLPQYMIPTALVPMTELPLTPNGKVDRRALPEPGQTRPELGSIYVPPQTELEVSIASIWQEVLQIEKVGIHDGFFDLGGHSLLMAQAHNLLRDVLGIDISMIDLFKYPTISALAKYLGDGFTESAVIDLPAENGRDDRRRESRKRQAQHGKKRLEIRRHQERLNDEARYV